MNKDSPKKRNGFLNVTQKMVAERAEVSQATVSHILNGNGENYNEETRRSVELAAKELGYRPNRAAQVMRSGRSNLIVHLNFGGYSELASLTSYHIGQAAHEAGFDYQPIDSFWWAGEGVKIIDRIFSFHPEGVIVSGAVQTEIDFAPLLEAKIPVSGIGIHIPGAPLIRVDVRDTLEKLTEHCLHLGRHPVLLLKGSREKMHWSTHDRREGYLNALQKAGFDTVQEWTVENTVPLWDGKFPAILWESRKPNLFHPFEAGERAGEWLLDIGHVPDAMLCSNDFYAIGIMNVLSNAGIRIPETVALSGYDNLSYSMQKTIALTTVKQPIRAVCVEAIKLLLDQINTAPSKRKCLNVKKYLKPSIQWRNTLPKIPIPENVCNPV